MEEKRFSDRFNENPLPYLIDKARKNELEAQKKKSEELAMRAITDPLTGLFNRRGLDEKLKDIISRLNRDEGRMNSDPDYILVFVADVDSFKYINDTYGHTPAGDEAIKVVAKRFAREAEERRGIAGKVVVAPGVPVRLGGDEFVLIQEGKGEFSEERKEEIISRLQARMSLPVKDGEHSISISVGCSVLRRGENKSIQDLFEEADQELYINKQQNKLDETV